MKKNRFKKLLSLCFVLILLTWPAYRYFDYRELYYWSNFTDDSPEKLKESDKHGSLPVDLVDLRLHVNSDIIEQARNAFVENSQVFAFYIFFRDYILCISEPVYPVGPDKDLSHPKNPLALLKLWSYDHHLDYIFTQRKTIFSAMCLSPSKYNDYCEKLSQKIKNYANSGEILFFENDNINAILTTLGPNMTIIVGWFAEDYVPGQKIPALTGVVAAKDDSVAHLVAILPRHSNIVENDYYIEVSKILSSMEIVNCKTVTGEQWDKMIEATEDVIREQIKGRI